MSHHARWPHSIISKSKNKKTIIISGSAVREDKHVHPDGKLEEETPEFSRRSERHRKRTPFTHWHRGSRGLPKTTQAAVCASFVCHDSQTRWSARRSWTLICWDQNGLQSCTFLTPSAWRVLRNSKWAFNGVIMWSTHTQSEGRICSRVRHECLFLAKVSFVGISVQIPTKLLIDESWKSPVD